MSENLPAKPAPVTRDPWAALRSSSCARIGLGRAGGSLPTHEWLDFKAAHAAARDAVHIEFDAERLAGDVSRLGVEALVVSSAVPDRATFLQRPDLGRQLDPASQQLLAELIPAEERPDLAIIVSDGLSALAAQTQTAPLLAELLPKLQHAGWRLAPIIIARYGRVALQDQIGSLLGAQLALTLIGERPGLGSPDSLGAYLTYDPKLGNTDAQRNCVSNIRPAGLPYAAAAETLSYLLNQSRQRRLSGVHLKDQRVIQ